MKSIGVVRKVDRLGRIVIPMELRRSLGIGEKDPLEIYQEGEKIILKRHLPSCILCGSTDDVHFFEDKYICRSCLEDL